MLEKLAPRLLGGDSRLIDRASDASERRGASFSSIPPDGEIEGVMWTAAPCSDV